jgi:hypothetical protein
MTTQIDDKFFSSENEAKSNWIKFGKVGDWFKATLLGVREIDSAFQPDTKVTVYDIKVHSGEFHDMDDNKQPVEPAVVLEAGQFYSVGGKAGINTQMRNVKKGQIFGAKFIELVPSKTKGFNASKSIKIYYDGSMDEQWLEENKTVDDQMKDDKPF